MTTVSSLSELEASQAHRFNVAFLKSMPWFAGALCLTAGGLYLDGVEFNATAGTFTIGTFLLVLSAIPWFAVVKYWKGVSDLRRVLVEYRSARETLFLAGRSAQIREIRQAIYDVRIKARTNELVNEFLQFKLPALNRRLIELRQNELRAELGKEHREFSQQADHRLNEIKNDLPIFKARASIKASLEFLESRRAELHEQWEAAYPSFSWWNKLKYSGGPDFSELDRMIKDLKFMDSRMSVHHADDLKLLERHFSALKNNASKRVLECKARAEEYIRQHAGSEGIDSDILKKSLWFSAMSIPVSVWSDVDQASDVFDALRGVNGQFAGMSDSEIWWETIFLPTESLAGLAALTKGAYFEQVVAADTGGELFEHFNNPGTDIVIDGTAFQLKATGAESYVNSVADGIPVIATSEVAVNTSAIDSGYSNEELTNATDLALGGTVVDVGNTSVDAILAGVGGLGLFATFAGLRHAVDKHENGGDGVEAMFEGAGVAIEGTARALVGAAEMGYNVLSSRPSRFMGRAVLKGLKKLDDKMMGDSSQK